MQTKKSVNQLIENTRAASDQLREGLKTIRKRISELQLKRDEIKNMPPEVQTALARMAIWVDHQSVSARKLGPSAIRFCEVESSYERPTIIDRECAAFAYLGPLIKAALTTEIVDRYKTIPGISDDERANRLADIDRELLDAELSEESIIRSAEAAGFRLARRGSADPRAVLAADQDLP